MLVLAFILASAQGGIEPTLTAQQLADALCLPAEQQDPKAREVIEAIGGFSDPAVPIPALDSLEVDLLADLNGLLETGQCPPLPEHPPADASGAKAVEGARDAGESANQPEPMQPIEGRKEIVAELLKGLKKILASIKRESDLRTGLERLQDDMSDFSRASLQRQEWPPPSCNSCERDWQSLQQLQEAVRRMPKAAPKSEHGPGLGAALESLARQEDQVRKLCSAVRPVAGIDFAALDRDYGYFAWTPSRQLIAPAVKRAGSFRKQSCQKR